MDRYGSGDLDSIPGISDVDVIHLCDQMTTMYRLTGSGHHQGAWAAMWSALASALRKCYQTTGTNPGRGGRSDVACYLLEQVCEAFDYLQPHLGRSPELLVGMYEVVEALHLFIMRREHYRDKVTEERIDCLRGHTGVEDLRYPADTVAVLKSHGFGEGRSMRPTGAWYTAQ
jgi:hypothetical protein